MKVGLAIGRLFDGRAEKVLNTALQKIEDGIQKKNASFKFTREESKKRRQA